MKFTISFDPAADSLEDVQAAVAGAYGSAPAAKTEKPKETAAQKKKRVADEKKAADAEAEKATEPTVTRDEVRAKLKEYALAANKDAAIQVLKDNGASSIGELDEDKFITVIETAEAKIAEAADLDGM